MIIENEQTPTVLQPCCKSFQRRKAQRRIGIQEEPERGDQIVLAFNRRFRGEDIRAEDSSPLDLLHGDVAHRLRDFDSRDLIRQIL